MSAKIIEISTENIPLVDMGPQEGAARTYEEHSEDLQVATPLTYTRTPRIPPVRARMNTYDEYTPSGLHGHHSNEASPPSCPPEAFPGTQFVRESTIWDVYNNEARIVDNELVKDWMSSLNFLLLFVSLACMCLVTNPDIYPGGHILSCAERIYYREHEHAPAGPR
jgi:hypothetical protein